MFPVLFLDLVIIALGLSLFPEIKKVMVDNLCWLSIIILLTSVLLAAILRYEPLWRRLGSPVP